VNAYSGDLAHQPWLQASSAGCVGGLDRVDPDGVVEGWCWRPHAPSSRASVVIQMDGVPVAYARCDSMRPDLATAGLGDGACGFLIVLPNEMLGAGDNATITLHDAETGRLLDHARKLPRSHPPEPVPAARLIEGNLDGISPEGIVSGWCWQPLQPSARTIVAIDGQFIGTTRAETMRPDLLRAGIGNGAHGFAFALPTSLLEASGIITISVADAATGQSFGIPCVANPGRLSATQDLVADLQHQIRRLKADLAALTAHIAHREAASPVQTLLATLGVLFTDLATEHATRNAGPPTTRRPLPSDIAPPPEPGLTLAITAEPRATIIVPATAELACLAGCLKTLHENQIDRQADIIVLAPKGAFADASLLHGEIANLQIAEAHSANLADALIEIANPAIPVIVLAPIVRPDANWLEHLIATASHHPNAAIIGGQVIGEHDGLLRHAALDADPQGMPIATGAFNLAGKYPNRHLRRVEAVGGMSFLISPQGLETLRHHPVALRHPTCLGDEALDICLRIRQSGRNVLVQPAASATCSDSADLTPYMPDLLGAHVQHRDAWNARPNLRPRSGNALLIVNSVPQNDDPAIQARLARLNSHGFDITVAVTAPGDHTQAAFAWLEASGALVLDRSCGESIRSHLQTSGSSIDVIEFITEPPSASLLQRVRTLAPQATIIVPDAHRSFVPLSSDDRTALTLLSNASDPKTNQAKRPSKNPAKQQGIAIIADFNDPRCANVLRSLMSEILPTLSITNPDLPVLIIATRHSSSAARKIAGSKRPNIAVHRITNASLRRLQTMRIAISPLHISNFPNQSLEANPQNTLDLRSAPCWQAALCLAAGLPVVSVAPAGLSENTCATPIIWADTSESLLQTLRTLLNDDPVWDMHSAAASSHYQSILKPAAISLLYREFVHLDLSSPVTPPA
jgi:hypothetical protein